MSESAEGARAVRRRAPQASAEGGLVHAAGSPGLVASVARSLRRWLLQPESLAVLGLLAIYVAIMSEHMHSLDGLVMYRQARAIVFDHSLHFHPSGGPYTATRWGPTSKYGLGLSLLYVPGLLLLWWLAPHSPPPPANPYDIASLFFDPVYALAAAPVNIVVTVASAYLVARFVRALGFGRTVALTGLLLYGLASPAIVYARGDWAQPLTGLCWIAALYSALRFRQEGRQGFATVCGLAVFWAVLTRPVEGSILVPAIPLTVGRWDRRDLRLGVAVVAGYLAGLAATLLVDWGRFGSPFETGYGNESWTTPLPVGLAGSLISPGRGILWEFPAVILAPLGVRALWQRGGRGVALGLAGLVLAELLNVATWHIWWGGWCWGLRLFVPALPVLAVLVACGAAAVPRSLRIAVPLLALAGAVWALPCVLSDFSAGYAAMADGTSRSFQLQAYPPIGAWRYLHGLRVHTAHDVSGVDIEWLRQARSTHNLSLIPPLLLGGAALACAWRAGSLLRAPDERKV